MPQDWEVDEYGNGSFLYKGQFRGRMAPTRKGDLSCRLHKSKCVDRICRKDEIPTPREFANWLSLAVPFEDGDNNDSKAAKIVMHTQQLQSMRRESVLSRA